MVDELPQFEEEPHPSLVFLGRWFGPSYPNYSSKSYNWDLYYFSENGKYPTVMARFGNNPADYDSGLVHAYGEKPHRALQEAKNRAKIKGLNVMNASYYGVNE